MKKSNTQKLKPQTRQQWIDLMTSTGAGGANIVFTRNNNSGVVYMWIRSNGVLRKICGCWYQLRQGQWRAPYSKQMHITFFKQLFGFRLPQGYKVSCDIRLTGGMRKK